MTVRQKMKPLVVLFLAMLVLGSCNDRVETSYATYEEARRDRLFERGWLPSIIPRSSRSIEVISDVDTNTAQGSFEFSAGTDNEFVSHLKECMKPYLHLEELGDLFQKGYRPFCWEDNGSYWTFYIDRSRGRCSFIMVPASR